VIGGRTLPRKKNPAPKNAKPNKKPPKKKQGEKRKKTLKRKNHSIQPKKAQKTQKKKNKRKTTAKMCWAFGMFRTSAVASEFTGEGRERRGRVFSGIRGEKGAAGTSEREDPSAELNQKNPKKNGDGSGKNICTAREGKGRKKHNGGIMHYVQGEEGNRRKQRVLMGLTALCVRVPGLLEREPCQVASDQYLPGGNNYNGEEGRKRRSKAIRSGR